eukprot:Gb_12979 [translate_table: standard]
MMATVALSRSIPAQIIQTFKHRYTILGIRLSFSNDNHRYAVFSAFYCTVPSSIIPSTVSTANSSETSPITTFLLHECGFSLADVNDVCRRKPDLLGHESYKKAEQTAMFLKQRGFKQIDIRRLFFRCPNILRLSFEQTVKPKVEFLEKIGLTGDKLLKVLSKYPTVLTLSINRALIPRISYLQTVLDPKSNEDSISNSVEIPRSLIVQHSRTLYIICKNPRILGRSVAQILVGLVKHVEILGIERGSKMFVHALVMLERMNKETVKRKFENLTQLGFSEEEVLMLVRRMPHILEASEEKLRGNMKFLVDEWNVPHDTLAKTPALLLYSVEKRLKPRLEVLVSVMSKKSPKKGYFPSSFIAMTDDSFRRKVLSRLPVLAEEANSS